MTIGVLNIQLSEKIYTEIHYYIKKIINFENIEIMAYENKDFILQTAK